MLSDNEISPSVNSQPFSLDLDTYNKLYKESISNPQGFWADQADEHLVWFKQWDSVCEHDTRRAEFKWFSGGVLNASFNCIDRHLEDKAEQAAIIFEGDDPAHTQTITFQQLHDEVCRLANGLKARGVKKGDRVCIYMPTIPKAVFAMLACARIGAVHTVVFGGFSPEALRGRINDCECSVVITADYANRGGKKIPLKANVDVACENTPSVKLIVVDGLANESQPNHQIAEISYDQIVAAQPTVCEPEPMDAEAPLFILYTSGSTGKPKGVLHTTGGYLLYAAMTFKYVFDFRPDDVYWCTADVGWITGHSYLCYGPLINGAQTVMFEGVPSFPDASRFWQIIDRHKVSIFYTAPTALRSLMGAGDKFLANTSRESLRVLGTVGEPINPEVWQWYSQVVGRANCPIVDTWWQTETGGVLIAPIPGAIDAKPGSATLPFFGVVPQIVNDQGEVLDGEATGNLVISSSWPGQMRGIFNDPERFHKTYYADYPGHYSTGDGARRDKDGYFWITGRVDDVLNVSGHRLGTAEIESALVLHPDVSEAAVVGYAHPIKGQGVYAYVTLMEDSTYSDELANQLVLHVRKEIGPIATPDVVHWAPALPKTRSGKIMRRVLRKIADNDLSDIGDTSTLADSSVITVLIENKPD